MMSPWPDVNSEVTSDAARSCLTVAALPAVLACRASRFVCKPCRDISGCFGHTKRPVGLSQKQISAARFHRRGAGKTVDSNRASAGTRVNGTGGRAEIDLAARSTRRYARSGPAHMNVASAGIERCCSRDFPGANVPALGVQSRIARNIAGGNMAAGACCMQVA